MGCIYNGVCSSLVDLFLWQQVTNSLTVSISCQSSLPITVPVHSPSVNSPTNYLIPTLLFLFALLHPSISTCTSITPVLTLNCNYFATMVYLLPYLPNLITFAHTVHRVFYCVIDCMFVYPMCNSVLLFSSHCFALSWPGGSCK